MKKHPPQDQLKEQRKLAGMLATGDFASIKSTLNQRNDLSRDQRYALGFSAIAEGHLMEGFSIWWPLYGKMGQLFDTDCSDLARQVYADDLFDVEKTPAQHNQLKSLYIAARRLFPLSHATYLLRCAFIRRSWNEGYYEDLANVLESPAEPTDREQFLNLAKLRFLRLRGKKVDSYFVSTFLTASATYLIGRKDEFSFEEGLDSFTTELILALRDQQNLQSIVQVDVQALKTLATTALLRETPGWLIPTPSYVHLNPPRLENMDSWLEKVRRIDGGAAYLRENFQSLLNSCIDSPPNDARFHTSVLDVANPFEIFGLDRFCSKRAVMERTMECMHKSPDRMAGLRQAQAEIFNGQRRAAIEFLRYCEVPNPPPNFDVVKVDHRNLEYIKRRKPFVDHVIRN